MKKILCDEFQMITPMPVVVVSCGDNIEEYNATAISWCGNISSNPARVYISVNPSRHSCKIIEKNMSFVINIGTYELLKTIDYCGFISGKDLNKSEELGFTYKATEISAPQIEEFPVSILCEVEKTINFDSEILFIAKIHSVFMDEKISSSKEKTNFDNMIACSAIGYHILREKKKPYGFSISEKV